MANHKICEKCGATYGWGERCDCEEEAKREAVAQELQRRVKATMLLSTFGKRGKKNGRNAKPH